MVRHYLVGGLEHDFYFSIYWECHHPNWRTHIFQRGWNHQPDMDLDWVDISRWVHNGYIIIAKNSEWLQWLQSFTDGWSKFTCVYINLNHPWFPETDLCEQKKWPPSWNDFLDGDKKWTSIIFPSLELMGHILKCTTDGKLVMLPGFCSPFPLISLVCCCLPSCNLTSAVVKGQLNR